MELDDSTWIQLSLPRLWITAYKAERIWVEILFLYTFEQIRQFCVPEPHKQELHCKKRKFRNRKLKLKYTYS